MSDSRTTSGARRKIGMEDCCSRTCSRYSCQNSGRSSHLLARRQHLQRCQRGLTLENRLGGGEPVVVGGGLENRIEREVLSLEGVNHLMGEHQLELIAIGARHPEERGGIGVVIPRHLLGVEVQEQLPQSERVGEETEEPVGGFDTAHPGRRQLLVQLPHQIGSNLLLGSHGGARCGGKLEPHRLFDRRAQAVHQASQRLALHLAGLAPAGSERQRAGEDTRGESEPHAPVRRPVYQARIDGPSR